MLATLFERNDEKYIFKLYMCHFEYLCTVFIKRKSSTHTKERASTNDTTATSVRFLHDLQTVCGAIWKINADGISTLRSCVSRFLFLGSHSGGSSGKMSTT